MNVSNQLIELIRSNPRFAEASTHYVSVYHKDQQFGGHEEGGWWHAVYELQGSVSFPSREQAEVYVEHATELVSKLQSQANKQFRDAFVANYRDDSDYDDNDLCAGEVVDAGDYFVHIEEKQGSLDNTNEPVGHWE